MNDEPPTEMTMALERLDMLRKQFDDVVDLPRDSRERIRVFDEMAEQIKLCEKLHRELLQSRSR